MTAEGPVLRDIHLPPASWWPPAPGWWLLALVVVATAACIAWWLRRRRRRGPLHAALREIDAIESAYATSRDTARVADECSRLLRRVACRIDPFAASTTGTPWREFLHRHAHDDATRRALDDLDDTRFRANPELDTQALFVAMQTWCRVALWHRDNRRTEPTNTMRQLSP